MRSLDRITRRMLRRALGRHDRWSNPLLAYLPRRKRWTIDEVSELLTALFDQMIKRFYSADIVERLVYSRNPLLEMIQRGEA